MAKKYEIEQIFRINTITQLALIDVFESAKLPICKSGKCSTNAQCGSIWTWFLSASKRVTCPQVIVSSTSSDFDALSIVNALTNRRRTDACSNFCNAKWILAARALSHCGKIFGEKTN